ncbi:MAG TPA: DUF4340 domain-containing protein, partial [Spirochaetota bacterium]|nr:DUF4340 domain-containing protein [Spirochaetota bacterium]
GASPVNIHKKQGLWVVGNGELPADAMVETTIENKMKDLTFSELVTAKKFYERFDLTDDRAIRVTVKGNGKVLRDIIVGKKSSVGDLSYVKLSDRNEVYLAGGNLASECDRTMDTVRDKKLFSLTPDSIESVTVNAHGEKFTLVREAEKKSEKKDPMKDAPAPKGKWIVEGRAGEVNSDKITEYLSEFGSVLAQNFPDEKTVAGRTRSSVGDLTIKAKGKTITFTIYGKNDTDKGNTYLCKSTELPYYANVTSWKVERLMIKSADLFKKK